MTARIKGRRLHLRVKTLAEGLGRVHLVPFSVNRFTALHLENDGREQRLHPIKERAQLAGRSFDWYRWQSVLQESGNDGRLD
ncbi:MAG: hypothetical protein WBN03_20365 [Desulfobacterales bacterium]